MEANVEVVETHPLEVQVALARQCVCQGLLKYREPTRGLRTACAECIMLAKRIAAGV